MSMNDQNTGNTDHDDDVTQGENPGAQGDFGAGQGDPGTSDPIVGEGVAVEGDEQPRRADEHTDEQTDEFGGDLNAGNQLEHRATRRDASRAQ